MSKYLDFNGLAHYNDIITPAINNITNGQDKNFIELDKDVVYKIIEKLLKKYPYEI